MTISTADSETRHFKSILGHDYKEGDVDSMINQISHWSMFKFYKTEDLVKANQKVELAIDNITLKGNMPKENKAKEISEILRKDWKNYKKGA
jgi:hypothetical protein